MVIAYTRHDLRLQILSLRSTVTPLSNVEPCVYSMKHYRMKDMVRVTRVKPPHDLARSRQDVYHGEKFDYSAPPALVHVILTDVPNLSIGRQNCRSPIKYLASL